MTAIEKLVRVFLACCVGIELTACQDLHSSQMPETPSALAIVPEANPELEQPEIQLIAANQTRLPALRQFMPLAEVEDLLTAAGWQSLSPLPPELNRGSAPNCSGTGWGFCRFAFESRTGETLSMTTMGRDFSLVSWSLSGSLEGEDLDLPALEVGMAYEDARNLLLNEGWYGAIKATPRMYGEPNTPLNYLSAERGFLEVIECDRDRPNTCRFEFYSVTGQKLTAIATNVELGQEPLLESWELIEEQSR